MALNELQKQERSEYLEHNLTITECSQRKPYAFISYASSDWEAVFKSAVVPMQQQYGLRIYADKAFDQVNDRWIVPMLRNVRGADVMIAFVSQNYIESYACFLELLTAVNNKKQIVFVALDQQLELGDTTDQPNVERGVKAEILNQGQNIATNVNNSSNDLMRAMKSAYTSISTLLEQDALSKYDISDAFINFFRDAMVIQKPASDLNAIQRAVKSVSRDVFDKFLISAPVAPAPAREAAPAGGQDAPASQAAKKQPNKKLLIGAAAVVVALVLVLVLALGGGTKNVTDREYTAPHGNSGLYTGEWKDDMPNGYGTMTFEGGAVYEGEWKDGSPHGTGTCTYADGDVYEGAWKDGSFHGQGTYTWANGDVYVGEFKNGKRDGTGIQTDADGTIRDGEWSGGAFLRGTKTQASNGAVFEGSWDVGTGYFSSGKMTSAEGDVYEGTWDVTSGHFANGTITYANGDVYEGHSENGYKNGQGKITYAADGRVFEGTWKDGYWVRGLLTLTDGTTYEGEWDQETHTFSKGTKTEPDGDIFEGVWDSEGKYMLQGRKTVPSGDYRDGSWDPETGNFISGTARATMSDGRIYEGAWSNGTANGHGTMFYTDGTSRDGVWKDGNLVSWDDEDKSEEEDKEEDSGGEEGKGEEEGEG